LQSLRQEPISGAHLNPAVTIALASLKKIPWVKCTHYIVAQTLGAFLAAACVFATYYEAISSHDGGKRVAISLSGIQALNL